MSIRSLYIGLIIILLLFGQIGFSQENLMLYHLRSTPYSSRLNPALHNDSSKVAFGIALLNGANVSMNNAFSLSDAIKGKDLDGNQLFSFLKLYPNLIDKNYIHESFDMPIFFINASTKAGHFGFSIIEKEMAMLSFEKELVGFINNGNKEFIEKPFETKIPLTAIHYREYNLAYSREFLDNRLSVGLGLKLLYGKFAVKSNLTTTIATEEKAEYIDISTTGTIQLSAPATFKQTPEGNINGLDKINIENVGSYLFNAKNTGFGIDFGAVYKVNEKITVSASVVDIGKINWKNEVNTIALDGTFKWSGINISGIENQDTYVNETEKLSDSIANSFNSTLIQQNFATSIPTKIYIGGSYTLNKNISFGLVDRYIISDIYRQNSMMISANGLFSKYFSASASYAIVGKSYNNIGLGIGLNLGSFQLTAASDNLIGVFVPEKVHYTNFRFGINFLLGIK